MIKPIKLASQLIDAGTKVVSKNANKADGTLIETSSNLAEVNSQLLQSYKGVNVKKLFASFPEFVESFKAKLETFKDVIPEKLFKQIQTKTDAKDFSLQKTIGEYYSGLKDCKTLDEVTELYPEITVPKLPKIEDELTEGVKGSVTRDLHEAISKLPTREEKLKYIDKYFNTNISRQVENWEIYPELKEIQTKVANDIIDGKFVSTKNNKELEYLFARRMPLKYRLLKTENQDKVILDILREHYINGKNLTDINIKNLDGKEINAFRLRKNIEFSSMDKYFRAFIKSSEANAKQFQELSTLDRHEINSAILTKTWKSSKLRIDLGNETAYKKDWSIVKAVWQKTMFPETTFYPTDKLIDAFLLNLYKNGKTTGINQNPILKYLENPHMDKTKIMLLKRLYKSSKDLDMDKNILNSNGFKDFKSHFNLDEMKKTIESIEEHYKNSFFKRFWTDERKIRFTTALNENREIANQNIEISDQILTDALNSVFSEI